MYSRDLPKFSEKQVLVSGYKLKRMALESVNSALDWHYMI